MSPRAYDRTLRQAAAAEARRRIVEAAAVLHAKHGGSGTSHAMIAKKAGVSIPTVYKYFPTGDALVPACTGLVAGRAPVALNESIFSGHDRVADRVAALAQAVFRLHEYFAPWLRWSDSDAAAFPSLQRFLEEGRKGRLQLLRHALSAPGCRQPPEALLLPAHVLLEFPSWRTLTSTGKKSEEAAVIVTDAIVALERSAHEHARR